MKQEIENDLIDWYHTLDQNRGLRASLRRCKNVSEIFCAEGFQSLLGRTKSVWLRSASEEKSASNVQQSNFVALAIIAALFSHVKKNDNSASFAAQLGPNGKEKEVMSELRFKRLLLANTADELFRQLRRAISLREGSVNLVSLEDGVFALCRENNSFYRTVRPTDSIKVKWALDYFQAQDSKDFTK